MKNTIRNIFHSTKFVIGFVLFVLILIAMTVVPMITQRDAMTMYGMGNFFKPGTYISVKDAIQAKEYTLNVDTKTGNIGANLTDDNLALMKEWLLAYGGISEEDLNGAEASEILGYWETNYDSTIKVSGTAAKRKAFTRLAGTIEKLLSDADVIVAIENEETGELEASATIAANQFVNVSDLVNAQTFVLGTDNFGRDVLTELLVATRTSLRVGVIAGIVATLIGLFLGLMAGYIGGFVDDFIMFIANLFTVIPSFVILILISNAVGQSNRGVGLVAVIIGATAWTWTTRSVRSQVISLRNRDHVNLSKLSGHSLMRIVFTDILPYIASYVVMAFILQISSGILSEAQLSMLGLGPSTTTTPTLGNMMNWATMFNAHLNGSWWAYFPVVLMIALISFSLNLMNTGLDQVFNPQLRD